MTDQQLADRFEAREPPAWRDDTTFHQLLSVAEMNDLAHRFENYSIARRDFANEIWNLKPSSLGTTVRCSISL